MGSARLRVVMGLSLALIACSGRSVVGGGVDAATDDLVDAPDVLDRPDVPDVAPLDAPDVSELPDVPSIDRVDAGPPRCATNADCASSPAGPVCDAASGNCVACTPTDDRCPVGQYCVGGTSACATGCRDDSACVGTGPRDGGTSAARRCDTTSRACVDCLANPDCPAGTLCVGSVCVIGCTAAQPCPAGQACCSGACADPQSNLAHCGVCDRACSVPNGAPLCMNGTCAVGSCTAPFADCDRAPANGCETDTQRTIAHCGGCGLACAARPNSAVECAAGRCAYSCTAGFADCDGDASNGCETDTRVSVPHCGGCGRRCDLANATAACAAGNCAVASCDTGYGDCDGNAANGCEADLRTSVSHCGACRMACPSRPNSLQGCVASTCVLACLSGYQDCDSDATNGCEVDVRTSALHCGSCGRACRVAGGTGMCMSGSCTVLTCEPGFGDCDSDAANGCETSTLTAASHCGGCGRACPARANSAASCAAGACAYACNAGFADCDGDMTNGCETDTRTSDLHCGACNRACRPANATGACAMGSCTVAGCDTGYGDCDASAANGCEANLRTSTAHCGRCANACLAGATCAGGTCTAPVLASCSALHDAAPTLPSGAYTIDPDGAGGRDPFAVYCDMTTDGGGWTYGAIVRTTTSSDSRSRVAGVTAFGTPTGVLLDNEYSVNLTGVTYRSIRIDNFTLGRNVTRALTAAAVWSGDTYRSSGNFVSKRVVMGTGYDFRVGYYLAGYCGLDRTNIPMCFTSSTNPVEWVCDTDSGHVEGWVDGTGGEICGMYYCRMLWRDSACTSYVSATAVYGFAVR